MKTKDKDILCDAIDEHDSYTKACKSLLKAIIRLAVDDMAVVNVKSLSKITKLSNPVIYKSLKLLEEDGVIKVNSPVITNINLVNPHLQNIIERYHNKKSLLEEK